MSEKIKTVFEPDGNVCFMEFVVWYMAPAAWLGFIAGDAIHALTGGEQWAWVSLWAFLALGAVAVLLGYRADKKSHEAHGVPYESRFEWSAYGITMYVGIYVLPLSSLTYYWVTEGAGSGGMFG